MKSDRKLFLIALGLGLVITAAVFQLMNESEQRMQLQSYHSAAQDRVSVFRWKLSDTIDAVDAVSAFYAASQEVEQDEFAAFTRRIRQTHSAIEAITWLPRRSSDGRDSYPVEFLEPADHEAPYSRLDCAEEPECADALMRARRTGKIALTSQLELETDSSLRRNVMAILPIYANDTPQHLRSISNDPPIGYAAIFIDVADVWDATLKQLTPAGLTASIYGGTTGGRMQLLHHHAADVGLIDAPLPSWSSEISTATDIHIGGTTWRIVCTPTAAFFAAQATGRPWIVLAFGLLTTALIAIQLRLRAAHTQTVLDTNTQLTAAHQELELQRTQLRQIIDLVPHLIFVRDSSGRVLLANKATAQACGTSVAELVDENRSHLLGARLDSLGTLEDDEAVLAANAPRLLTDVTFTDIEDRTRTLNAVKIPYSFLGRHEDKQAVLCVAVDVTDIRAVEADKTRLEAELRHSQKMESIGVLAGGIAHDFNNLLGSIVGNTELAVGKIDPDSDLAMNLNEVLDASEHASKLVSQILTFSRKEELRLKRLDAAEVIHNALDLLRPSIPSNVELRRDIDGKAGLIMADETQIAQVVMNLCTNAYQAMKARGGVLDVGLDATVVDLAQASMQPGLEPGPHVRLRVRDTGCGIDHAILDHVFDPFFTTKDVREGTGLGLSVVHGIVSSHGGRIFIESEPGIGTTFTVYIPSASVASSYSEKDDDVVVAQSGREHVLLVDDDLALLQTATEMLEVLGYRVTACDAPSDALAKVRESPDAFDIVVTDQAMPTLTGTELARELMNVRPDLPIVVATGFSNHVSPDLAREFGLKGYVSKPYRLKDLGQALRSALDGGATIEA